MAEDRWDQVTGYCCGTCRYYSPKDDTVGRCRRNAPTMSGYPVVYPADDWCGNHKVGTNPHKEARTLKDVDVKITPREAREMPRPDDGYQYQV